MQTLIAIRGRKRFKTAALALTALVVSIAPALTLTGWIYLTGAVAFLVSLVVLCDALDLWTVYRDFLAWRKERDVEYRRVLANSRQRRAAGRLLR